jgi:hypothetical protein
MFSLTWYGCFSKSFQFRVNNKVGVQAASDYKRNETLHSGSLHCPTASTMIHDRVFVAYFPDLLPENVRSTLLNSDSD